MQKVLGIWSLTALVIGNMIGSGVFLLPAALAAIGSITLASWIITAIGAIALAFVFARLSTLCLKTGGPYTFAHMAFGNFSGFLVGTIYWASIWIGNAAIISALTGYLSFFYAPIGTHALFAFFIELTLLWIFTLINLLGIKQAGVTQMIMTLLKLIPLILIASVGLFFIKHQYISQWNVTHQSNTHAILAGISLTLWAFLGVESATVPADNVINPKLTIPIATIIGILITSIIYILSTTAVMGSLPMSILAKTNYPFIIAANAFFGDWGKWLFAFGAVIACLGTLNGFILLQGQIPMAMAEDGLFPSRFAKRNQNDAPTFAIIISSLLITFLFCLTLKKSLIYQFTFITLLAVFLTVIVYLYSILAEAKLSQNKKIPVIIAMVIAFIYCFWAVIGSGKWIILTGILVIIVIGAFYFIPKKNPKNKT